MSSAEVFIVGVPAKPRRSEIAFDVSAVGEWPVRVFPEESPHIEVLYSATPVDEMLGGTLAEANEHPAIPVEVVGMSLEEVIEVNDRDLGESLEVVRF